MKLTVQRVFDVVPLLAQIINEKRPMPQKGKYRLARLHAKLAPEYQVIVGQRDPMITRYEHFAQTSTTDADGNITVTAAATMSVPPDKIAEFNAEWAPIAATEIEVDVEPIPLAYLELGDAVNGAIEAGELLLLGDLVKE